MKKLLTILGMFMGITLFVNTANADLKQDASQSNDPKEEKQNLQRNIELKETFINTILSTLDEDKVSEVQNKFKLLEEMHNIERKNENSKNN